MFRVVYHVRANGTCLVRDWIAGQQDSRMRATIFAKIQRLKMNGHALKGTKSFVLIPGPDGELWEMRDVGWGWRIIVYHDLETARFVLLHGFRKKKKKEQQSDFAKGRELLHEYQRLGGCSDG